MHTTSNPIGMNAAPPSHWAFSILIALAKAIIGLLILVSALPVPLMAINSAVPWYVSLTLLAADVSLFIIFTQSRRTPRLVAEVWLGVITVSLASIWIAQLFAAVPLPVGGQAALLPDAASGLMIGGNSPQGS